MAFNRRLLAILAERGAAQEVGTACLGRRPMRALLALAGLLGATAFAGLPGCSANQPGSLFLGDDGGGAGGGSSGSADDGGGTMPAASSGSSGSSGGGSSGSSSGAASGGQGGGDAGNSDAQPAGNTSITSTLPDTSRYAYSVTLKMQSFTVNPNQEVYMCQDFANPFKGVQADIVSYELHMSQGSHHMFAFYKPNATNAALVTCPQGGLQFAPYTLTAGSPDAIETYPDSMGATIPATTGFTINAHFINTGASALTANLSLTMYVAKPGEVTQHIGPVFLNQALLSVPATGQPSTSTSSYALPQDVNFLLGASHMHQRATHFISTANGQTLYETTQWSEPPPKIYSPALHLGAGTNISWSCTYVNDTGSTLTFGESAQTNVMCISEFIYYPVADVTNPVIGTQL